VVWATGSDPVVPPIPGLRELQGIWTNRGVTGMKAVPRRLLILGGGAVGAEMAQAVRRLGGEVALVEGAGHLLAREPAPLGEALGEVLRADGVELVFGVQATAARRDGADYILALGNGRELRGDQLLVATGRRPRTSGLGLETAGAKFDEHGIQVDAHVRAGDRLWAIGDVTGIRLLTHVGKYQGEVVAANILGEPREANYEAVPDVVYTDPQAASVGATEAPFSATTPVSEVAKTATYTRAYAQSNGFLTLLSDGNRLTGAYALGPEAGEWLQQATLAIRARVPLQVLRDTIKPFPTFSEIYVDGLKALHSKIGAVRQTAQREPPGPAGRPGHHAAVIASTATQCRSTTLPRIGVEEGEENTNIDTRREMTSGRMASVRSRTGLRPRPRRPQDHDESDRPRQVGSSEVLERGYRRVLRPWRAPVVLDGAWPERTAHQHKDGLPVLLGASRSSPHFSVSH
jgi:hypothetical protein